MRELALIIWGLYVMIFCVNFGMYFIGNGLGIGELSDRSIDFETANTTFRNTGEDLATSDNAWNTILIFGNFITGTNTFWSLLSGGFVIDTMYLLGLPDIFVFPIEIMTFGLIILGGVLYYLSSR